MGKKIVKGTRVMPSGRGVTRKWKHKGKGIVTKRRGKSVFVHWDNTHFEDERNINEVKRIR